MKLLFQVICSSVNQFAFNNCIFNFLPNRVAYVFGGVFLLLCQYLFLLSWVEKHIGQKLLLVELLLLFYTHFIHIFGLVLVFVTLQKVCFDHLVDNIIMLKCFAQPGLILLLQYFFFAIASADSSGVQRLLHQMKWLMH